ncbi:GyrI-like domain-containing protein [Guptibacillus hwajinpoensis]|uniref:Transcriptional regulator YdeE n=1 Tax=Guptibacillus hwajinpoensis TaxID=208199 RepID=A0ABU0K010_9BACL|nr:GyrI-like domain-containing protein [Alkalihalobacillus hemicentroti]MDQ0481826.1 putative transcriptional regulator YdeE [Alkalihalobacillus hemicentroti]
MEEVNSLKIKGVIEVSEKKLVGFRVVCDDMKGYAEEIPKTSLLLNRRKDEIKNLIEPVRLYGAFKATETLEEDDGYWVCYEVYDFEDVPAGMVPLRVPAQKCAVLGFKGHSSDIFNVYPHLHRWIEDNGYKRSTDKWTIEVYSKWTSNEDEVDLCDPIY